MKVSVQWKKEKSHDGGVNHEKTQKMYHFDSSGGFACAQYDRMGSAKGYTRALGAKYNQHMGRARRHQWVSGWNVSSQWIHYTGRICDIGKQCDGIYTNGLCFFCGCAVLLLG